MLILVALPALTFPEPCLLYSTLVTSFHSIEVGEMPRSAGWGGRCCSHCCHRPYFCPFLPPPPFLPAPPPQGEDHTDSPRRNGSSWSSNHVRGINIWSKARPGPGGTRGKAHFALSMFPPEYLAPHRSSALLHNRQHRLLPLPKTCTNSIGQQCLFLLKQHFLHP